MSIKDAVGTDRYEAVRRALSATFPDAGTNIPDQLVDTAFQIAKHELNVPEFSSLKIPAPTLTVPAPAAAKAVEYYEASATHARSAAPHSVFTGHLPLVRYRLPLHGIRATAPTIHTPAGEVLPEDRLLTSVDTLWDRYGSDKLLKFGRPARVDVIGPPRLAGARFAAITLYLCYSKQTDPGPSFYVLEAGLATGQPRMLYLCRTMSGTLLYQTQYRPSAFSRPFHWYRGKLEMAPAERGEPVRLTVDVFEKRPPADQYLRVSVQYHKRLKPLLTNPFHITIGAAARIQAIADALGVPSGLDEKFLLRIVGNLSSLFTTIPQRNT